MTQSAGVAPGWYDDGHTAGVVRWFDGETWTEHTAPVPAPEPVPVPVQQTRSEPAVARQVAGAGWPGQGSGGGDPRFAPAPSFAGTPSFAGARSSAGTEPYAAAEPYAATQPYAASQPYAATQPFGAAQPSGAAPQHAFVPPSAGSAQPFGAAQHQPSAARSSGGAQPYAAPGFATPYASHVVAGASSPGRGPSDVLHWLVPTGRSWQSIVAGYVGLLAWLVWPLAPFAIGLGAWALVRAQSGGHGRGRAVFAILTGFVGLAVGALVLTGGFPAP